MRAGLAALLAVPLLIAGCGGGSTTDQTGAPCGTLPTADPSAALPAGFPALDGQVLYGPTTQGKTRIVFGLVAQGSFVAARDGLVDRLQAGGYTIVGTDQEAVEAEAEFAGPHEGRVKVQPLCQGYVTVRYVFTA